MSGAAAVPAAGNPLAGLLIEQTRATAVARREAATWRTMAQIALGEWHRHAEQLEVARHEIRRLRAELRTLRQPREAA